MAAILNQALPQQWVNPYQAGLDAQTAALNAPQAPTFTPEQIAQRQATNQRAQRWGILGLMMGDEGQQRAGGQVLQQALGASQQRVTDKGVFDPTTGQMTMNPEYAHAVSQQRQEHLQDLAARAGEAHLTREDQQAFQAQQAQEARASRNAQIEAARINANANEPLVPVLDPATGQAVYSRRSQAIGKPIGVAGGAGAGSEDERKAAGWYAQASTAYKNMQDAMAKDPTAAKPGYVEMAMAGKGNPADSTVAYASMSPARQAFSTAASSFSEAVLRAATGAGVNENEARQKINELTPRYGEDSSVTAMKGQMQEMYLQSLLSRAGRAAPKGATVPTATQPNVAGNLSAAEQAELAALRARYPHGAAR